MILGVGRTRWNHLNNTVVISWKHTWRHYQQKWSCANTLRINRVCGCRNLEKNVWRLKLTLIETYENQGKTRDSKHKHFMLKAEKISDNSKMKRGFLWKISIYMHTQTFAHMCNIFKYHIHNHRNLYIQVHLLG